MTNQPSLTIEVLDSFEAAEDCWRALERDGCGSVYQRYDWCKIWFQVIGRTNAKAPLIVVVLLDGKPALLLPLYVRRDIAGTRSATFMGNKHANVRVPLVGADAVERLQVLADQDALLPEIGERLKEVNVADLLALRCMPHTFNGTVNVLAPSWPQRWAHQLLAGRLAHDFQALSQERLSSRSAKRLRKKRRGLEKNGALALCRVEDLTTLHTALDDFFVQKAVRMEALEIDNPFNLAAHRDFVRALAEHSVVHGSALLDVYRLRLDGTTLALMAGGTFSGAFSGAINSMSMEQVHAAGSPGQLLTHDLVEHLCNDGLTNFDLGVGTDRYKLAWCDAHDLTTVRVALSSAGHLASALDVSKDGLSHLVMKHPMTARAARRIKYTLKRLVARL